MTTPINRAAYQVASKKRPFEVRPAPFPSPGKDEIIIKSAAIAINPVDWILQAQGTSFAFQWLKYPFILGEDVAGDVVEVGTGVTRFKRGDRVVGLCLGTNKERNRSEEAAFQEYTLLSSYLAAPLPNGMSYERASVIPLGFGTAAAGLFERDQLGIKLPSSDPQSRRETVIIWGGSTSVGCNAIQLAKAAGYDVIATASPRNFDYLKSLGAKEVFDYNSKTVSADIINTMQGKTCAGAMTLNMDGVSPCFDILHQCRGNKFITMAAFPVPNPPPKRFAIPIIMYTFVSFLIRAFFKSRITGVKYNFIFAGTITENGIGKAVFEDYLGKALEDNSFTPAPEPMVVGKGLECIQEAMEILKKGVSAKKVVVTV